MIARTQARGLLEVTESEADWVLSFVTLQKRPEEPVTVRLFRPEGGMEALHVGS